MAFGSLGRAITEFGVSYCTTLKDALGSWHELRLSLRVTAGDRRSCVGTPFALKTATSTRISLRRISVRVKNAKKPTRSIRYLLSADPRFQRISLRKISVRLKHAERPPRSIRSKESVRAKKSVRHRSGLNAETMVLVMIGVVAAATLIAAHQPPQHAGVATVAASLEPKAEIRSATAAAQPEPRKSVVVTNVPAATHATSNKVAADALRANTASFELVKHTAVQPPAKAPAGESAAKADVPESAPVIITGCLAFDGDTFQLQDTSGVDAPKSRSWKSGFLRKRSTSISISDAANSLTLSNYVGQRVAASGILINRDMQVRSLQRVAPACS
jgi:hypothetical protein